MSLSSVWKRLFALVIIIIIIIGGVIVIIKVPPIPDPGCMVCGPNAIKLLGIAEMIFGTIALILVNKIRTLEDNKRS